ncbi:MAG TPA: universal stress protein [Solirubrobacteraceae bacterium]|nr:universal stress protein [Solirubrobacteraceae bacterium]
MAARPFPSYRLGMFSNVVVGVNGREGGRDAAALAAALATPGAHATFARVHTSDLEPVPDSADGFGPPDRRLAASQVEAELRIWTGPAEGRVISAPSVGEGLERLAARRQADLIVIGACERGPLGRVLVGDDAASVLHHAQRAVALASKRYATTPHSIRRVGVAYDGSSPSDAAFRAAERLAHGRGASLVARCVVTPHVYATGVAAGAGYMEDPEDLIERTRAALGERRERVEIVVGPVGQELVNFSQTVDLLVCGSRHNRLLRRVTLGSTSGYLARHSGAPLVICGPAAQPEPSANQSAPTRGAYKEETAPPPLRGGGAAGAPGPAW